jgi:energy-coupling factor transport system substrate-specific component
MIYAEHFFGKRYSFGLHFAAVAFTAVGFGIFNSFLAEANSRIIGLPLFLDTIGTLVSTALFGLVPGLITAFVTHFLPFVFPFLVQGYYPWVVCSISSVLVMWLFVRNGMFRNLVHLVIVILVVTLANAITGAVVAVFLFSGITDHPVDYLVTGFLSIGHNLVSAAFWARIPMNLIDKSIAAIIAFVAYRLYVRRLEREKEEDS